MTETELIPSILIYFSLAVLGLLLGFVLMGLKKNWFSQGYSILWTGLIFVMALVIVFSKPLYSFSLSLGFSGLAPLLFFGGICMNLFFGIVVSIHISKLRRSFVRLNQEIGITSLDGKGATQ